MSWLGLIGIALAVILLAQVALIVVFAWVGAEVEAEDDRSEPGAAP